MKRIPTDNTVSRLERELAYYRREMNELGAKVLRLQEEQHRSFIDTQRSRLLLKMARQLFGLGDRRGPLALLPELVLGVVVENAICACAALLREDELGSGVFSLTESVGLSVAKRPGLLRLRRTPPFVFTTGEAEPEPTAAQIAAFLNVPYVLWSYDAPSGYALVLGNRLEVNASRAFSSDDRELVETALTVFLDTQSRVPQTPTVFEEDGADVDSEAYGLEGGESLRQQLRRGSHITGVLIVERPGAGGCDYVAYLRVTWKQGWHVLRSWRGRNDRVYRVLNPLVQMLRSDLEYTGPITMYAVGDPELERIPMVAARERQRIGPADNETRSRSRHGTKSHV